MERKVIVIVGPTCSGKTKLSLEIAERLKSEIISADSRQVYKFLSIGTAKPALEELKKIKHHFIDVTNPDESFNVSKFENKAVSIIEKLLDQEKIPVVVGGSGLYIKAVVDGIFDSVDTDEVLRKKLLKVKREEGIKKLYSMLEECDPVSASKMLPQNWKRVIRAIEVFHISGKPIWKLQEEYERNFNFEFHQIGLLWEREQLYKNIERRVDEMINNGLVKEVQQLIIKGYDKNLNSLNTVGYKEIIDYIEGNISLQKSIELIKRNTRRFAKRQMTWFRKDKRIKWIDINNNTDFKHTAESIISMIT